MLRALQAEMNRLLNGAITKMTASQAKVYRGFRIVVDGKIGNGTVNTYMLLNRGLGGALPLSSETVTKKILADNAETVARFLQGVSDKNGFPPAEVSIPGAPAAPPASSAGFGPTSQTQFRISPDEAEMLMRRMIPPEDGLPASELVVAPVDLPSMTPAAPLPPPPPPAPVPKPFYKKPAFIIGGALGLLGLFGLGVFFARKRS
jgi:hypothetical protein